MKKFTLCLGLLTVMVSAAFALSGNLRVGAWRTDITPPVNPLYPPSGRYAHERLNVRAIVIDNGHTRAVLIGADLADITTELWETAAPGIASMVDCPIDHIVMSATHSHSACPAGPPPPKFNEYDKDKVAIAMTEAVKNALTLMQPAVMGYGSGEAHLNVNRDAISKTTRLWTQDVNTSAPSDKTVAVLSFTTPSGKPIAAYMNYAMHPNNAYLSGITSADFPGAMSCYVEEAFGEGMVAIFTQGASGDQNPLYHRPATNALLSKSDKAISGFVQEREPAEYPLRKGVVPHGRLAPQVAEGLERYIDALGVILGEEAIRIISNTTHRDTVADIWGTQRVISLPGRSRVKDGGREGVPSEYAPGDSIRVRLGCLGIGSTALSTIDAEIYTTFGTQLKRLSPLTNTMFVTLANGRTNSGYIIADADYGKYTFQVLGNRIQPGHAETTIVDTLVKEINEFLTVKQERP